MSNIYHDLMAAKGAKPVPMYTSKAEAERLAREAQELKERKLAKGASYISGDEPGLTVLIGAHPDAVPLERVGHQSGRAAHS